MKIFLSFLIATIVFYLLSELSDFLSSKAYQRGHEILGTVFSFLYLLFFTSFIVLAFCCLAAFAFLLGGKL